MTREWRPGEVGLDLRWGYLGIFIKDCGTHLRESCWHNQSGFADPGTDDRRPLVVIDPEDREQVERFVAGYEKAARLITPGNPGRADDMQAALREFADPKPPKPPKPEEPTGLGAVVEDEDGQQWVRIFVDNEQTRDIQVRWADGEARSSWDDIAAVRVLSEGVQA